MSKYKKLLLIGLTIFVVVSSYGIFHIYSVWNPNQIVRSFLIDYKKSYPDISFSMKTTDSSFDGSYNLNIGGLVLSQKSNPILRVNSIRVEIPLMTLMSKKGSVIVKLDQVMTNAVEHFFLERELNKWLKAFSQDYQLNLEWLNWRHDLARGELVLDNGLLVFTDDPSLKSNFNVNTSLSFVKNKKEVLAVDLIGSADTQAWFSLGEINLESDIKLRKLNYLEFITTDKLIQSLNVLLSLNKMGNLKFSMKASGDLINGSFQSELTQKKLSLSSIDLNFNSKALRTKNALTGELRLSGDWNFFSVEKELESNLTFTSANLNWKKYPLELNGKITKEIDYNLSTNFGGVGVHITGNSDFAFSENKVSLDLTQFENEKVDTTLWRELLIQRRTSWFSSHETYLNFQDIKIKEQLVSGRIQWEQSVKGIRESLEATLYSGSSGKLQASYMKTIKNEKSCNLIVQLFPVEVFFWMAPEEWSNISGQANGEGKCLNDSSYQLKLTSKEIDAPLFSINKSLKKLKNKKIKIYKEDKFSSMDFLWDDKQMNSILFKNRIYQIKGETVSPYFVLKVQGQSLNFQSKNNGERSKWNLAEIEK